MNQKAQPVHERPPQPAAQPLVPLRFPLHGGSRLIEASAGTGKTWTITALYVRLVLGHGGDVAFPRPLTPPDILVVTFTNAATQELRERIRERLHQAGAFFRQLPEVSSGDDFLDGLRRDFDATQWRACARRLEVAAQWMDGAAISTIHGWCQRMLGEHAFGCGGMFGQNVCEDQDELHMQAMHDYWRTFCYPLSPDLAASYSALWSTPQALHSELKHLSSVLDALPGDGEAPQQALQRQAELVRSIKARWINGSWVDKLQALLDKACADGAINGNKLFPKRYTPWLNSLRRWTADSALEFPDLSDTARKRLTPQGMKDACKDGRTPVTHPALEDLSTLHECIASTRSALLCHAARWTAARFARAQQQHAEIGFDDLIHQLDDALRGQGGTHLAETIRRQFPVALIDEFQDTDALQYRIFSTVYGVQQPAPDTALILIGDPKQSIYAFRGADIHTYLKARRHTAGHWYTLDTNHRSTAAMVDAVNHLFSQAEQRQNSAGAFHFRREDGDNPLPFLPVTARGRKEQLLIRKKTVPALNLWRLESREDPSKDTGTGEYHQRMAEVCAAEIVRLLHLGQRGQAGFSEPGEPLRPLRPSDVAILVNNGAEAAAVRRALKRSGVHSVYLSENESVFASPYAIELQFWLNACAGPEDTRLLRSALGTSALGLSWAQLDALNHDEQALEQRVLQFTRYHRIWRRQGVLPMLRHLLHDFAVPQRLLARGDQRALTDILHLAELLQQASATQQGEHALLRWLRDMRLDSAAADRDARRLRLESDAALVQVVTVHKSKGLEYPLVFLPFACHLRQANKPPLIWHDGQGRICVSLNKNDKDAIARADAERLGEDLRRLYVALTRARHALWMGWAPVSKLSITAPGYLLGIEDKNASAQLPGLLQKLAEGCAPNIALLTDPPEQPQDAFAPAAEPEAQTAAMPPLPARRPAWWIASYSALPGSADSSPPDTPALLADADSSETPGEQTPSADEASPGEAAPGSLHAFPRGTAAGTFFHGLLEWAARQGFAHVAQNGEATRRHVARWCRHHGYEALGDTLGEWLMQWLQTPFALPDAATPLHLCALQHSLAEMEFHFAVQHTSATALDRLVQQHTLGGMPRPDLLPAEINGMLKGFIDLVFEHEGRYYVADYKSTWLGKDDAAYTPHTMRQTVARHRYDLQYALYTFALHRLLQARLPGYDCERHLGGAITFFLRGMHAASTGLHVERLPRALIEGMDALFRHSASGTVAATSHARAS